RAATYSTVRDVDLVEELFPRYPEDRNAPIVAEADLIGVVGDDAQPTTAGVGLGTDGPEVAAGTELAATDVQAALESVERALAAVPHLLGEGDGTGSNSWVVSGEHTASGSPILANDPHLGISAPGIWSQVGLYCTTVGPDCPFTVSGFGFAGLPGVIIGHNADLAWGLTNLGADVTDFYLERTDPDGGTYTRDGEQVPLTTRTEVIEVNGGDAVTLEVRSTEHGPIVSDVLDLGRALGSPTPNGGGQGRIEVSLAWTALHPGRTADAVFAFAQ